VYLLYRENKTYQVIGLPLDYFSWNLDLGELIMLVVEEVEGEIITERVVGKEDAFEVVVLVEKEAGGEAR